MGTRAWSGVGQKGKKKEKKEVLLRGDKISVRNTFSDLMHRMVTKIIMH
jgi:hypothetical protein